MTAQKGFTMMEVIIMLVVTGILMSVIFLAISTSGLKTPLMLKESIAMQTARQCMEWFIGQRRLLGYSAFSCPSTTVPSFCTAPAGYTLGVNITCTTISSDANYQTIAVTVTGSGNASLTTLVGNY